MAGRKKAAPAPSLMLGVANGGYVGSDPAGGAYWRAVVGANSREGTAATKDDARAAMRAALSELREGAGS